MSDCSGPDCTHPSHDEGNPRKGEGSTPPADPKRDAPLGAKLFGKLWSRLSAMIQGDPEPPEGGPASALDAQLLRAMLKRHVPPSWFTKRHTPGVRANYRAALRGMGKESRKWCKIFFGAP